MTPNTKTLFDSNDDARFFYRKCEGGGKIFHTYHDIISVDNLFISWKEFSCDKKKRKDVVLFAMNLMDNIFKLHYELKNKTYKHASYQAFKINDPKPRDIHKAIVRDRLVHRAMYRILYPHFDKKFIHDSYSCRLEKGTHKAIYRFESFSRKVSKNNTKTCWVLKCDIRKFFASIDHSILKSILEKHIQDKDTLNLLCNIIDSFETAKSVNGGGIASALNSNKQISAMADICKGLLLGNLTSQLLVNVYMNEFDQFMKHELKIKYYIRYADDFVILNTNKTELEDLQSKIAEYLEKSLKLTLHPDKVFIKTLASGVDFLGWVHFPKHRVLRTATKKRMFRNLKMNNNPNAIA